MNFDYSKIATRSPDKILDKFGQAVTLSRQAAEPYDVATGTVAITPTTQTATGAVFEYKNFNIDGTLIQAGDRQLLLSAEGITAPQNNDTVTIGGAVFTITQIMTIKPAGTVVLYECNIRGTT